MLIWESDQSDLLFLKYFDSSFVFKILILIFTGLDEATPQYADLITEHGIDGKKLLMLTHYDLEKIGIDKLGHQELILEAVDLLKSLVNTNSCTLGAYSRGCRSAEIFGKYKLMYTRGLF